MTKKTHKTFFKLVPFLVLLCLMLTGCKCKHEWAEADCDTPKTCSLCQLTEGAALGHTYADATCEAPKTCTVCQATEGEALGHTWVEATCLVAKTCSVCQKTEGELADHSWMDATTEAPKTCSVCQVTEGERIITDSRFKTANNKELFGTWSGIAKVDCQEIVGPGFTTKAEMNIAITFNPDGSFRQVSALANKDTFDQKVEEYLIKTLYQTFTDQGYNKAQANEAMVETYGMTVEAYAKKQNEAVNWEVLFAYDLTGVYYVADGKMYSGITWKSTMDQDTFSISGNALTIETLQKTYPELVLTLNEVTV